MEKIIDTVDFDYPHCGGYEVFLGRKYLTVYEYSNYSGCKSGAHCRIPITSPTAIALIEIAQETYDRDDISGLLCGFDFIGGHIIQ